MTSSPTYHPLGLSNLSSSSNRYPILVSIIPRSANCLQEQLLQRFPAIIAQTSAQEMDQLDTGNPQTCSAVIAKAFQHAVADLKMIIDKLPNTNIGAQVLLSKAKRLESHLTTAAILPEAAEANYEETERAAEKALKDATEEAKEKASKFPLTAEAFETNAAQVVARDNEVMAELVKIQSSQKRSHDVVLVREQTSFNKNNEMMCAMEDAILKRVDGRADDIKQTLAAVESTVGKAGPSASDFQKELDDFKKTVSLQAQHDLWRIS